MEASVTDDTAAAAVQLDVSSLQERVKAARERRQPAKVVTVEIPGYKGLLFGKYRRPAWRKRREIADGLDTETDDRITRELCIAADFLVASCVGVEAHIDGEVQDLNVTLGTSLAAWLDLTGADSDRQAVFLILPDEDDLTDHSEIVIREQRVADGRNVDDDVAGESVAAS